MQREQEEKRRQEAIRLYEQGGKVPEICERLQVSRPWFYKWRKRFQSGEPDWFCEQSRRPHRVANKTSLKQERVVIGIRRRLEKAKYSQRGALAIQWEMEKLGVEPLPTWTIDRILKRHHLVRAKRKYQPSGKPYPDLKKIFSASIQQADLLGPRHIHKDGHFYSLNVIDLESYLAAINPSRSKADVAVAENLLRSWKTIGKPDFLQMDNELSFRGSNRHPHSFGLVIRMCLALEVQPIFIPIAEPWRNGAVEKLRMSSTRSSSVDSPLKTIGNSATRPICLNVFGMRITVALPSVVKYRLNLSKSRILPCNDSPEPFCFQTSTFLWPTGISI